MKNDVSGRPYDQKNDTDQVQVSSNLHRYVFIVVLFSVLLLLAGLIVCQSVRVLIVQL